jgi:hypothetical protein
VRQITRRLHETNRIGAKESGGRECAPTLLALNDVDSVEVVCKGKDSPKPSANELPDHISGYLSPRHGIGPKYSHTQSYLHDCVFNTWKGQPREGDLPQGSRGRQRHCWRSMHPGKHLYPRSRSDTQYVTGVDELQAHPKDRESQSPLELEATPVFEPSTA